jgi:hypothetical protein
MKVGVNERPGQTSWPDRMIGDANRVSASDAKRATVHCCRGHRSAVTSSPGFAYRSEFSNDHRYIARDDGILGRATLRPASPLSSQSSPDCCADRNPGQAPELQSAGARGMTIDQIVQVYVWRDPSSHASLFTVEQDLDAACSPTPSHPDAAAGTAPASELRLSSPRPPSLVLP